MPRAPHKNNPPRRGRAAFTLMELLVVMGIMGLITAVATASYFGMTRAASYNAAENSVLKMLQLARQRACMDGNSVFFMLIDENTYVLVHGVGRLTSDMESNGRFYDRYSELASYEEGMRKPRIWNMEPKTGDNKAYFAEIDRIETTQVNEDLYPNAGAKCFRNNTSIRVKLTSDSGGYRNWRKGDRYGFELYPPQKLPKGFKFHLSSVGQDIKHEKLVFHPNGTFSRTGGEGDSDNVTLELREAIDPDGRRAAKIRVEHSGLIKVEPALK